MDYYVFISYSRKDTAVADRVCAAFDEAGISYFIDRQGIGGAVEFPDEIARAIKGCRKMLFLASRNAYASRYTKREIFFAFNEKNDSDIIPYLLDGSDMPDSLRFVFSTTNVRNMREHPIETVLIDDILRLLGRDRAAVRPEREEGRFGVRLPRPSAKPAAAAAAIFAIVAVAGCIFGYGAAEQPEPAVAAATDCAKAYEIGDYYNENGMEGVVFEVDGTGRHGKITGMKQTYVQWCADSEYEKGVATAAVDMADGSHNMRIVGCIDGWQDRYPAFAWCSGQGDGWYLPAIGELESLMQDSVYEAVNRTLSAHKGMLLAHRNSRLLYWSSSEYAAGECCAWTINIYASDCNPYRKNLHNCVRAVAAF